MSLIVPLNSGFSQPVNHFATQPHLTCPKIDFFSLFQVCPVQDEVGGCSSVLVGTAITLNEFIDELPKQLDDARFVLRNKNFEIPNEMKNSIIRGEFSSHNISDRTAQFLIKNLNPEISYDDFIKLIQKYGRTFFPPIITKFVDLYKISYPAEDFNVLEYLHTVSRNDGILHFWNKHNKYLMSEETLEQAFRKWTPSSVNFLKWLHDQGVPHKWFNLPNANGRTSLQWIARRGDIELINRIAKDIPKDQIKLASDFSFEEEMRDCFIQGEQPDLSRFDPNKIMIAQNGCRAAVMTDVGETYSYPGQDASKLAQQMANGMTMDSFTIYHNPGHVSIAFSDAHFGFYPGNTEAIEIDERMAVLHAGIGVTKASVWGGATLGMQPGYSSFTDSFKSKVAAGVPQNIWVSKNMDIFYIPPVPCKVIDDSSQKIFSDMTNGLSLTVYAPKEKVEAVRQYAVKIQDACNTGNPTSTFHLFTNNCIDFVRQAVQASGTKADFRDAFHTMQYYRRLGYANVYTMLRSNQPMIQSNSSLLDAASIPEAVDRVSRNAIVGAILSIPGIFYTYLVYKGIPKAIATTARAASRIQRAVTSITGFAVGTIFQGRILRRNG